MAGTSAVVITYNSADVIGACVAGLREFAPGVRVLVIDNASLDGTAEQARAAGAEVIANRENRGFAGAVNQGFRETDTDIVLVLNPDVRLRTGIGALEAAARKHGVAGGILLDEDGRAQRGFTVRRLPTPAALALELLGVNRLWPGNPWNRRYRCQDVDLSRPGPVEQPAGAFLAIRRDVWAKLGGFDEQFHPVWFEDVDFCRRALDGGFGAWIVPEAQAFHVGGHSIGSMAPCRKQVQWYDSLLRYAAKHFRPAGYGWVWLAGVVGVVPRAIAGVIQHRTLGSIGCSFHVLKLLGSRLVTRPPSGQVDRPGSDG